MLYEKKKCEITPYHVTCKKFRLSACQNTAKYISDNFNFHIILSEKIPADFDGVHQKECAVLFLALLCLIEFNFFQYFSCVKSVSEQNRDENCKFAL